MQQRHPGGRTCRQTAITLVSAFAAWLSIPAIAYAAMRYKANRRNVG